MIAARADIAYVSRQMGHAKMTTTLLYYGHWFKHGDRHYVEQMESVRAAAAPLKLPTRHDDSGMVLDGDEAPSGDSWHQYGPKSKSATSDVSEVADSPGGPSGTRTPDPLIKSQLLCQLS